MPPDTLNLRPFPDGNGAEITINGGTAFNISAGEIDRLIVDLIGLRAHLNPKRVKGNPADGTEMMSGPELSWAIGPGVEKETAQLALFHPGLGWWCVDLNAAETMKAVGLLTEVATGMRTGRAN